MSVEFRLAWRRAHRSGVQSSDRSHQSPFQLSLPHGLRKQMSLMETKHSSIQPQHTGVSTAPTKEARQWTNTANERNDGPGGCHAHTAPQYDCLDHTALARYCVRHYEALGREYFRLYHLAISPNNTPPRPAMMIVYRET